jgi:predicted RecB family nuclease
VPAYSLKDVEALPAFQRQAQVKSGTRAVLAYEQWMDTRSGALLGEIAAYNEENCRATLALRDRLVDHRPDDAAWRSPTPRPAADSGTRDESTGGTGGSRRC